MLKKHAHISLSKVKSKMMQQKKLLAIVLQRCAQSWKDNVLKNSYLI
jgi:hypothetical protein